MIYIKYQKRLYDLRIDHDLRQEDIAKILNTTKQTYGRYENGTRKLQIEDLIKLAEYYNVTTDYLLGLSDNPKQNWENKNNININNNNIKNSKINIKQR